MGLQRPEGWTASKHILYADTLYRTGSPVLSLKHYEKGLRLVDGKTERWIAKAIERYIDVCLIASEYSVAKETLEGISLDFRTLKNWRQLASVYDHFGELKSAIDAYKSVLRFLDKFT